MSLKKYKEKRDFQKTPEPEGKEEKSQGPLRFVIQKHEASHLHYDLRLEMGGVMKSWAVPKGPQSDPEIKRLAMETEDHPISYNEFEGIIPQGQYGGGTVMVWDEGYYVPFGVEDIDESDKKVSEMYHKGEIKFVISGKKMKGEYVLVKTKRDDAENAWLLIKHDDEYASKKELTDADKSVKTGRSMDEIAKGAVGKGEVWNSDRELDLENTKKSKMPHDVKPMLATLTDKSFDSDDFIFEIKWDGYRAITEVGKKIKIYSRNLLSFNELYEPIVKALENSEHQMVLDGEVVILNEEGKPSFQLMQNYKRTKEGELIYYVFDILFLDGNDLQDLPLIKRKEILEKVIPNQPNIKISTHIEKDGKDFFEAAQKQNLEGIIAKKKNSPYRQGVRSEEWLKIKTKKRQEAIICGFTEPKGGRKYLGALVLGIYENGKYKYIGHTGGKINDELLKELRQKLEKIETENSPFDETPKTNAPVHWVKPTYIAEISFQEWTDAGTMRIPIFEGLREDKKPEEVNKEVELPVEETRKKFPKLNAKKTEEYEGVQVSNLDKVLWPDEGYTKKDLIEYYEKIAPIILPYLKNRPESLFRNPNGIESDGFFQKNMDGDLPEFAETIKIQSESEERSINYLLCQNKETLIYMANLGCIEINPWNSTTEDLEKPTYTLIDLDPLDIEFSEVIKTANAVREILEESEIPSYCKTSGATGIHIYIPMGNKYNYEDIRKFAEIIAMLVNEKLPDITSVERKPEKRKGKVYLDYLQNRHGQTLASAYCVRPKPSATVSTPLKWEEVNSKLNPKNFTIKTIFRRLDKVGDLWKPTLGEGIDLNETLMRLMSNYNKK